MQFTAVQHVALYNMGPQSRGMSGAFFTVQNIRCMVWEEAGTTITITITITIPNSNDSNYNKNQQ